MGLFSRKPKDGVRGTAQVVSSTAHGGRATHQTCRLNLVVQAEGMQPYSVEHAQICPASKWPHPGSVLPVVVSRKDPSNLKIDFDAMPDAADVARQRAEQQAAMMRNGGATGATGAMFGGAPVTIVGGTAADIPPEMRAGLEQMLGVDIDGDGRIGGGSGDRLAQLERLAHLHATGALTTAEFEAEKRRILRP
jgi:Short C-terminal domain